ncbi:(2Fe-2S)-binding protein [Shewanella sp. NFH-SH190041]|uniref:bacterioferritin-associated ferredoxin n=1 Tax=Shewanella sp. NFH-SH190041 TaxID=2950245 RepID=UPI0021C2F7F5|nr:bacterioferritin-associated ferredoxin [Shewanella sp. NFH-SH190041]BDM65792.1 (2Fe-2S)-binding protein [Shewanella sp. NFH-SH190041]
MFVCVCHAITDSQIRQAVAAGAHSLAEVKQQLGVASQCGKCAKLAGQIIKQQANTSANYYQVA